MVNSRYDSVHPTDPSGVEPVAAKSARGAGEPTYDKVLQPFVAIARAFAEPEATQEEVLRRAIEHRRDWENTPPEVRQRLALDALAAIQKALQESGVTEKELQAEGRRIRRQLVREKYGQLPRSSRSSPRDT